MKSAAEWLTSEQTYTTCVLAILLDKWEGYEFFEWDPITINLQIKDDFGVEPTQDLMDKVNAAAALFSTNTYFNDLETFSSITNVLNLGVASSEFMIPPDVDDCLWAVTESMLLLGDIFKDEKFSPEISEYIGHVLTEEGIEDPPDMLAFASYRSENQGNIDDNLKDDELNQAYWTAQQEDKDFLNKYNRERLVELFNQIEQLPIKSLNLEWLNKSRGKLLRILAV